MSKKQKANSLKKVNEDKKNIDLGGFAKQKPGFVVAVLLFVVLVLFVLVFNFFGNIDPQMEAIYAKDLHENNLEIINYQQESIITQFSGQYYDPFEDDMIYSVKDDLDWLKEKESEIYNSKPSNEVLVKEFAFSYFLGDALVVNQEFLYEDYDFVNEEEIINEAISLNFVSKKIVSEDIDALFEGEEQRRIIFEKTYNKLIADYVLWKKNLINSDISLERKIVEAKKIILITIQES